MNTPNIYTAPAGFEDHLVTLNDGRQGIRGAIQMEVRDPVGPVTPPGDPLSENSCNSCLDFISSDETLDRYGEVISASGWKLDTYRKNPVFQNAHQYGDIIFTLGRALVTEVRSGKLHQRISFAVDANPMAKVAHALYAGKFLNAVSVGFVPLKWEDGNQATSYSRKFLEQELLEVSAVAIPANPNALALAYKSGAVEKSDLRELADLLRHTLAADHRTTETPQHRSTLVPAPKLHAPCSTLALATALRDLLKHV